MGPPVAVQEWLVFVGVALSTSGLVAGGIAFAWRRVVRPIHDAMHRIERALTVVEHELAVNGDEFDLPDALRNRPLRSLVIEHIRWNGREHALLEEGFGQLERGHQELALTHRQIKERLGMLEG